MIIGLTTLVNAQEPISFRSNALGGIIDDDLDLIYDPIELRFVGVGKTDTLSGNGIYDIGEKYIDEGNNIWNEGETFFDKNGKKIYDDDEPFRDFGNGIYDEGEVFEDLPIIKERNNIHLYTNLSNLTSKQEQLFDNLSDDEFLFGVSSRNPLLKFLWHSALVRLKNSRTPNLVSIDSDLDGIPNISNKGNLIDEYTAYLDNTGNDGLYDIKKMFSQEKSDFTTDDSYSFILNNTLKMWRLTLGAKLSQGNATQTGNNASYPLGSGNGHLSQVNSSDPTFRRSVITYLISDKYNNLIWSERGSFESDYTYNNTNYSFSVLAKYFGIEFRGDLMSNLNQSLYKINDLYSGQFENFDPEISGYKDFYSETASYISIIEEDGTWLSYGASIRKTFNEQEERKNDGFWKVGISVNSGSSDYTDSTKHEFLSITNYFDGLDALDTDFERTVSEQNSISDIGEKKLNSYNFYGRFNIPLDEYVHFGFGGYFNQSTTNRETDYIESQYDVTDYDYTDSEYNDDDYVIAETSLLKADRNYDVSTTTFSCPFGLEYKIGKKRDWSLRFGSIFTNTSQTINDAKQITDSEPFVSETEYGDGDVTIDINDNIYESTTENTRTISSSTIFTYGIGCNPMENLQIDVLGFLDSQSSILDAEFYRDLRISFTMKF